MITAERSAAWRFQLTSPLVLAIDRAARLALM